MARPWRCILCAALGGVCVGGGGHMCAGRSCKLEMLCSKGKKTTKKTSDLTTEHLRGSKQSNLSLERHVNPCRAAPSHFPAAPASTPAHRLSPRDDATCNLMHKHNIKVQVEGTAVIQQELKCKVFLALLPLLRFVMCNPAFHLCDVTLKFDASSRTTTAAKHNRVTLD